MSWVTIILGIIAVAGIAILIVGNMRDSEVAMTTGFIMMTLGILFLFVYHLLSFLNKYGQ